MLTLWAKKVNVMSKKPLKLKLTLVRSPIGSLPKHKRTLIALGLRKMHHSVIHYDSPIIQGMIQKIDYMLSIEECAS